MCLDEFRLGVGARPRGGGNNYAVPAEKADKDLLGRKTTTSEGNPNDGGVGSRISHNVCRSMKSEHVVVLGNGPPRKDSRKSQ